MKTKKTKKNEPTVPVIVELKTLHIKSAGLYDGEWGIILTDGSKLGGVQEILQTQPAYSDGFVVTAKIFIPFKNKPITKSV